MAALRRFLILAAASCGYLSYIPSLFGRGERRATGAGLIGSVVGLLTTGWLPMTVFRQILFLVGAILVAVVISDAAEAYMDRKDDPRIVIDEWIGYWVTVAFLPHSTAILILALIAFRLFDVFKLPWIRCSGNLPGGWGVVVDDVFAGIVANVLVRAIHYVHPFPL